MRISPFSDICSPVKWPVGLNDLSGVTDETDLEGCSRIIYQALRWPGPPWNPTEKPIEIVNNPDPVIIAGTFSPHQMLDLDKGI